MRTPDQDRRHACPKCGGKAGEGGCSKCSAETALQRLGEGEALDQNVRTWAERGFGRSLGEVRVHRGGEAGAVADELGARAFSVGEHVGFPPGEYAPGTLSGDAVIAHELAHRLQFDPAAPPARTSHEHHANRLAAGAMLGTGRPGGQPPRTGLRLQGCTDDRPKVSTRPATGMGPGLPSGTDSVTHTVDEYKSMWEKNTGRSMTGAEEKTLAKGCVGVSAVNLGTGTPSLTECYDGSTSPTDGLAKATKRADEIEKSTGKRPFIYSKRFWSGGRDYKGDPASGKVDMSDYWSRTDKHKPKAGGGGYTNFDYGWYDEKTGSWFHANHCDPKVSSTCKSKGDMKVYESTLEHYSRPLADFDRQVFCVDSSKIF